MTRRGTPLGVLMVCALVAAAANVLAVALLDSFDFFDYFGLALRGALACAAWLAVAYFVAASLAPNAFGSADHVPAPWYRGPMNVSRTVPRIVAATIGFYAVGVVAMILLWSEHPGDGWFLGVIGRRDPVMKQMIENEAAAIFLTHGVTALVLQTAFVAILRRAPEFARRPATLAGVLSAFAVLVWLAVEVARTALAPDALKGDSFSAIDHLMAALALSSPPGRLSPGVGLYANVVFPAWLVIRAAALRQADCILAALPNGENPVSGDRRSISRFTGAAAALVGTVAFILAFTALFAFLPPKMPWIEP